VNDMLQGELSRAGKSMWRLAINSTIGLGGFCDPASKIGVPGHGEDFGQTLAVWGVEVSAVPTLRSMPSHTSATRNASQARRIPLRQRRAWRCSVMAARASFSSVARSQPSGMPAAADAAFEVASFLIAPCADSAC